MQLLSRSFLQMAMGEAFDPSTIEKIVIEDFDADYDEDSLYADIDATVNIHFKDAQTARFKMEYQMVEYENNWYIAT